MTKHPDRARVAPIRSELQRKGYTKDAVVVKCCVCRKEVVCKWTRNTTPGINYGRPLIQLPDDWKVILTYGTTKQDTCCPNCDPNDIKEGVLLLGN